LGGGGQSSASLQPVELPIQLMEASIASRKLVRFIFQANELGFIQRVYDITGIFNQEDFSNSPILEWKRL
jgi:hypothetical protein